MLQVTLSVPPLLPRPHAPAGGAANGAPQPPVAEGAGSQDGAQQGRSQSGHKSRGGEPTPTGGWVERGRLGLFGATGPAGSRDPITTFKRIDRAHGVC